MRSTRSPSWIDRLFGLNPIPAPPWAFALDSHGLTRAKFESTESGHWRLEGPVRLELEAPWLEPGHLGGLPRPGDALTQLVGRALDGVDTPLRSASVVLPDAWLRLAFTESPQLPTSLKARQEIVQFKLRRLVPYRIEDLRLSAEEITPLPGQEEPSRLLVGFGTDVLITAIETAFEAHDIHVGRITSRSLALAAALEGVLPTSNLGAVLASDPAGFSLTLAHRGEPLLQRRKEGVEPGPLVERELRLMKTYLAERFPGESIQRCFLAVPHEDLSAWLNLLRECLDVEAETLTTSILPITGPVGGVNWDEAAMLFGAARVEVE